MNDAEIAWAAGLFEGEGSILYRDDLPVLQLGTTDRDVLARFVAAVGTGKVNGPYRSNGHKTPEGRKPIYHWRITGLKGVFRVLDGFYPYLGERRRQRAAQVVAEYYLSPKKRIPARRPRSALSV